VEGWLDNLEDQLRGVDSLVLVVRVRMDLVNFHLVGR